MKEFQCRKGFAEVRTEMFVEQLIENKILCLEINN